MNTLQLRGIILVICLISKLCRNSNNIINIWKKIAQRKG